MLIELKSSAIDPMNTPSRMLQRFKETLILKPNSRIALHSALISANTDYFINLVGNWKINGSTTEITFTATGANDYWTYKTTEDIPSYYRPATGGAWFIYDTEPTTIQQAPSANATTNFVTNTLIINTSTYYKPATSRVIARHSLADKSVVKEEDDTIMINITNFPINSRNSSGNTDNHIATMPLLTDLNNISNSTQFYEPYNPTAHSLDNEAELNMNFIEVELLNTDGTQRTDLIHPTQITLRITNEISSN
tara:strand:+ start:629 stop:1384 length:756 start_codon:yes stop_codon:yes gene_type:complete